MEQTKPVRHALLIGVDFYPVKPLRGCVRDVRGIHAHLETRSVPFKFDILTATADQNPQAPKLLEEPSNWPTCENIISRLENIVASSRPGDFVYIHFAGHGTHLPPLPGENRKHRSTSDLALVLISECDGKSIRYFRGLELAYYLKRLGSKGVVVNVVLDCCFSGSVTRGQFDSSRFLPYDQPIDELTLGSGRKVLDDSYASLDSRDGSLLPNWMINPEGYSIITACGPHESAWEISLPNNEHAGALSHFLLLVLSNLGNEDKQMGHIYQYLCARFVDRDWPAQRKQTPMLFGSRSFSFLGALNTKYSPYSIPLFRSDTGSLLLRAGEAHGIRDRDMVNVYPMQSELNSPDGTAKAVQLCVEKADALTSTLIGLKGLQVPTEISKDWRAEVVDSLILRTIPIYVIGNGIEDFRKAADNKQILLVPKTVTEVEPCSFSIDLNEKDGYEITDHSGELVTTISSSSTADHDQIKDKVLCILQHLVRFRQIQAIGNDSPLSKIKGLFSVRILADNQWHDCGNVIQAKNHDELKLEIVNSGHRPLYFHIYNLGQLWQIENILDSNHEVIPPENIDKGFTGKEILRLEMCVPDELIDVGKNSCNDIVKIFVTDQPTSFDVLTMENLASTASSKSAWEDLRRLPIFSGRSDNEAASPDIADWAVVDIHIHTST